MSSDKPFIELLDTLYGEIGNLKEHHKVFISEVRNAKVIADKSKEICDLKNIINDLVYWTDKLASKDLSIYDSMESLLRQWRGILIAYNEALDRFNDIEKQERC